MNSTVLQKISSKNFSHLSLECIFAPAERVLCSFIVQERISISRQLTNFAKWSNSGKMYIRHPFRNREVFAVVINIERYIVHLESDVTMLNNIVSNCEQYY